MDSPVRCGKIRSQLAGLVGRLGHAAGAGDSLWWTAAPREPGEEQGSLNEMLIQATQVRAL